jgi:hypothetical protein
MSRGAPERAAEEFAVARSARAPRIGEQMQDCLEALTVEQLADGRRQFDRALPHGTVGKDGRVDVRPEAVPAEWPQQGLEGRARARHHACQ